MGQCRGSDRQTGQILKLILSLPSVDTSPSSFLHSCFLPLWDLSKAHILGRSVQPAAANSSWNLLLDEFLGKVMTACGSGKPCPWHFGKVLRCSMCWHQSIKSGRRAATIIFLTVPSLCSVEHLLETSFPFFRCSFGVQMVIQEVSGKRKPQTEGESTYCGGDLRKQGSRSSI